MFNQIYERISSLSTGSNGFTGSDIRSPEFVRMPIVALAIKCAAAHWYLLPGLEFQRYGLALAISTGGSRDRSRSELANSLHSLPATFYLEADFALQCLRNQSNIGSYLDFASPWLLPLYLINKFATERAVFMSPDVSSHAAVRRFLWLRRKNRRVQQRPPAILSNKLERLSEFPESFDTITCLARISPPDRQIVLVQQLWNALKPGGTLIVSLPTTPDSRTLAALGVPSLTSIHSDPARQSPTDGRSISGLGRARRYAIYAEDAQKRRAPTRTKSTTDSWRVISSVAKRWRRYPNFALIRGHGLVAMKFVKPVTS